MTIYNPKDTLESNEWVISLLKVSAIYFMLLSKTKKEKENYNTG